MTTLIDPTQILGGVATGGINYITNNLAEVDTSPWVTYADAAGVAPVDGIGGSPAVTWTRNTSSPLRGVADFLFTKDAVNRQGQGFSVDFTVNRADSPRPIYVSFDYITSANYADDDIRIWIYDVTNAALIQPAPYLLKKVNTPESFTCVFQTPSNSTSFRLIGHVGSTSALSFTCNFDNFKVGPSYALVQSPTTDWQAYTPAWTSEGTQPAIGNGTVNGMWRRVGDTMQVKIQWTAGTTTTAGTGNYRLSIPSGYSVDSTKLNGGVIYQNNIVGQATIYDNGGSSWPASVHWHPTNLLLYVIYWLDGGTEIKESQSWITNGPMAITNGDQVIVEATLPIAGWSSSILMSDNADSRSLSFFALNTSGQSFAHNTWDVASNTPVFDSHGAYDNGASVYRVPISGYFKVSAQAVFVNNTTGARAVRIQKNGVDTGIGDYGAADSGTSPSTRRCVGTIRCNAGDTIRWQAYQTSGGNLAFYNATTELSPNFSIERISGPSQIAATETVSAMYENRAGTAVPNNSEQSMDFPTKIWDSHGAVTGTGTGFQATYTNGWRFICPVSGKYLVKAIWQTASSGAMVDGTNLYVAAYVSGTRQAVLHNHFLGSTATSRQVGAGGSATIRCLAGDAIYITVYQNSGVTPSLQTSNNYNYVCIDRIGNY